MKIIFDELYFYDNTNYFDEPQFVREVDDNHENQDESLLHFYYFLAVYILSLCIVVYILFIYVHSFYERMAGFVHRIRMERRRRGALGLAL